MLVESVSGTDAAAPVALAAPVAAPLKMTMEQAIERLGTGRFQRRLLLAAGFCAASDAMEVLLLSFLAIVAQHEFDVGPDEGSLLTSSVFIGAMMGTLVLGRLGDMIGRKPMFIVSCCIISIAGILTATSQTYWMLLMFRFTVGIGLGGVVIPYDTMAEFLPNGERSQYLLVLGYFWTIGTVAVPALAYVGLQETSSWRLFVLLCSFPCVLSTFFAILWVPESPRWLESKGQNDKALAILRQAAVVNGRDPADLFPEGVQFIDDPSEETEMHSIGALLTPEWRRMTLAIWAVWAGKSFMYWGTMQLVTLVFSDQNQVDLEPGEDYSFDYAAILSSSLAEIVGQTIAITLVERAGRVMLQSCMYLLCGISGVALCLLASATSDRGALIGAAFMARMFAMGASNLSWLVTAELLPTRIRNTGHSSAAAVARIGGACSPWLISSENSYETIALAFGVISLWTSGMALLLPETTGRALGTANSSSFNAAGSSSFTAHSSSFNVEEEGSSRTNRTIE